MHQPLETIFSRGYLDDCLDRWATQTSLDLSARGGGMDVRRQAMLR
jgi:hypothetical protein